jgi:LCP family protein required for cell wall assembly
MSNIPSTPGRPQRRSSRKPGIAGTALKVVGVITVAVLAAAAFYAGYLFKVLHGNHKSLPSIGVLLRPPSVAEAFPDRQSINLMIIGRDYDYTNQDVPMKTNARADLLMMANLDFVNNQIKILSIPRDTKADIPGHKISKINSAEEKGGPTLTAATVLQNFNIPEDYYVALDFDGFQKAIDQLGGVDLVVDKKMDYDDNWGGLHIHLKPGFQHLNGYKAMGFVRFRHSDSDLVRTTRQQALLAALKNKVDNPAVILPALPHLINTMNNSSDTDFTDGQKVALAYWLRSVPKANIQMETVPSVEAGYYVLTDWPKAAPIIKDFFGVDPPEGVSMVEPVAVAPPRRHYRRHIPQTL